MRGCVALCPFVVASVRHVVVTLARPSLSHLPRFERGNESLVICRRLGIGLRRWQPVRDQRPDLLGREAAALEALASADMDHSRPPCSRTVAAGAPRFPFGFPLFAFQLSALASSPSHLPRVNLQFPGNSLLEPLLRRGTSRLDLGDERFSAADPSGQRQLRQPQPPPLSSTPAQSTGSCRHSDGCS